MTNQFQMLGFGTNVVSGGAGFSTTAMEHTADTTNYYTAPATFFDDADISQFTMCFMLYNPTDAIDSAPYWGNADHYFQHKEPALGFSPWQYRHFNFRLRGQNLASLLAFDTDDDIRINGEVYHARIYEYNRWVCVGVSYDRDTGNMSVRYSNWNGQDLENDTPAVPAISPITKRTDTDLREWDLLAMHWGKQTSTSGCHHHACNIYFAQEYIDLSVDANWEKFFNLSTLRPVYLGDTGELPTGTAAEGYFPDGDMTSNLGTGGNWVKTGTISVSSLSPTDDELP